MVIDQMLPLLQPYCTRLQSTPPQVAPFVYTLVQDDSVAQVDVVHPPAAERLLVLALPVALAAAVLLVLPWAPPLLPANELLASEEPTMAALPPEEVARAVLLPPPPAPVGALPPDGLVPQPPVSRATSSPVMGVSSVGLFNGGTAFLGGRAMRD